LPGSGARDADAVLADVPPAVVAAEPGAVVCVVEIGPATVPEVSDVVLLAAPDVLVFAADAELAPPLQPVMAAVARTIETRAERYIFPSCC
jgi:hypothetical protein